MIKTFSMPPPQRLCLALLVAALLVTLLSTIFHVEITEQKALLQTRDVVNQNITVSPKVLIDWELYVQKGRALLCAMDATEQNAAQFLPANVPVNSEWVNYGDLDAWGWKPTKRTDDGITDSLLRRIFPGVNIDPSQNIYVELFHIIETSREGLNYPASNGFYCNWYNPQSGAIIASNTRSPEASKPGLARYPKCRRWSGVTFLEWQHMAQGNVQNLNHVFRSAVRNPDTLEIMRTVLGKPPGWDDWADYRKWEDARSFYPGSDAFNALLYTPNVCGVAWMLIQHKRQMGHRRISKITILGSYDGAILYLKIDPVPS